jgi:hypothetical protein
MPIVSAGVIYRRRYGRALSACHPQLILCRRDKAIYSFYFSSRVVAEAESSARSAI